jgi:hypothetical protein
MWIGWGDKEYILNFGGKFFGKLSRFGIFTAMKTDSIVFCVRTPFSLVGRYRH